MRGRNRRVRGSRVADQGGPFEQPATPDVVPDADAAALSGEWDAVAKALRQSLGARSFDHWLKAVVPHGFCADSGILTLHAPTSFSANWVNERVAEKLALAWRAHRPGVRHVIVRVGRRGSIGPGAATAPDDAASPASASAAAMLDAAPFPSAMVAAGSRHAFDPRQSFANFLIDRSNNLAASAAQRMATVEAPLFNPLFLQAGTGQGKTHLLHAIGQQFATVRPDATIIMMSAEKFMMEFVTAVRARDTMAFKARLRAADLLLIDDLQFVMGKDSTQQELLHTFDEIMTSGRRLVVAADRPPAMLDGVESRLVSRLDGGLVADIEPPEPALREAILRRRIAQSPGADVPEEVIGWLGRHFTRNIRELEGALNKLLAYAGLTGTPICLALAQERLADNLRCSRSRITIDDIQRAVCAHFQLDRTAMTSTRRLRAIARPRQLAMYLAKELTPRSYPEIGRRFGGRDHSTVIHAVQRIEELRVKDGELDADLAAIRRALQRG